MATAIEFENIGKQYEYRPDREECQAIFVASCVENAALAENTSPSETYCLVMMSCMPKAGRT